MKLIKKLIIFVVLIVLGILGVITYKGYDMYKTAIEEVSLDEKVEAIQLDKDYVEFDELPDQYIAAVIDVEDHRFYDHNGIDFISIGRAIVNNIKEKRIVEGGSTITQQLVKNMYFTQEKELVRKVAEIFLVKALEKNYEKDDIFELYVNTSYFGDGYYGIGQASEGYFNKKPIEMTLLESTLIAGIPNAPSIYAPTKNLDLAYQRQKQVIQKMLKRGHLTEEEANMLYSEIDKTN